MRYPLSTPTGEHQVWQKVTCKSFVGKTFLFVPLLQVVDVYQEKRNKNEKNKEKQVNVMEPNVNHLIYD